MAGLAKLNSFRVEDSNAIVPAAIAGAEACMINPVCVAAVTRGMLYLAGTLAATGSGVILLKKLDEHSKKLDSNSGYKVSSSSPGMPDPDDDGKDPKYKNWVKDADGKWHNKGGEDFNGISNRPAVRDPELVEAFQELWRDKGGKNIDDIPGGSAEMLRREVEIGGNLKHLNKVEQRITQIDRRIRDFGSPLSRSDREIAIRVLEDLRDAYNKAVGK